jgi:hypothetical protein
MPVFRTKTVDLQLVTDPEGSEEFTVMPVALSTTIGGCRMPGRFWHRPGDLADPLRAPSHDSVQKAAEAAFRRRADLRPWYIFL